jgi:protein-disulfide isomerase
LREDDLAKIFIELGLKPDDLPERLAAVKPGVLAERDKARAVGINSTPTIFIAGKPIPLSKTGESNLAKLITEALAAEQKPAQQ